MRITNSYDLPWMDLAGKGKFQGQRKSLSGAAGGQALGCSLYKLSAGRSSFPKHCHLANEEAVYVISGTPTIVVADEERTLKAGDYIAFPKGPDHAHTMRNDGGEDAVYLCISTMIDPDVMLYPDSGNILVIAGRAPGGISAGDYEIIKRVKVIPVDYYDGEDTGADDA